MKDFVRKPLNIVTLLLMAIDFFVIMYCGYALADNRARYSIAAYLDTTDMYLTFREDTAFEENDETIVVPKGTVIKPAEDIIFMNRIGFYYSPEGLSNEECKAMDLSEREEHGVRHLGAKPEYFEEYKELERLWKEETDKVTVERTRAFLHIFIPVGLLSLVWLVAWFFLTLYSCKKGYYVFLYVADVILLPVAILGFSVFLLH